MPPALIRWLRGLGLLLAVAGCAYVAQRAWHSASGAGLRWPPAGPAALALACCTLAMAALACGWYALLRASGARVAWSSALRAYARSQPAKYLPGNVLHFAARHAFGRADGSAHAPLLSAAALEATSLVGVALLICASLAPAEMLARVGLERWPLMLGGTAGLLASAAVVAHRQGARGLAWLCSHFAAAGGYFFASSGAFHLLCADQSPTMQWTLPAVSGSWVAGFVVIGAPGGIGVREATLLQVLGDAQAPALVGAIIGFRLACIAADLCLFAATWLLPAPAPLPEA